STTCSATVYVFAIENECVTCADPLAVLPSPKSHFQSAMVPSGSLDPEPSNVSVCARVPVDGPVRCAIGGLFASVTTMVQASDVAVPPSLSVTVSFTTYGPAAA